MLDCFKLIFKIIGNLLGMLFKIDLGFTSLGMFMSVLFIFFPTALLVINFLKYMKGDKEK